MYPILLNITFIVFSALAGFNNGLRLKVEFHNETDIDLVFLGFIIILVPIMCIIIIGYPIYTRKIISLRKPSLMRFSLNWWKDPVQLLMLVVIMAFGYTFCEIISFAIINKIMWNSLIYNLTFAVSALLGLVLSLFLYRRHFEK